jgi:hypothetical protein
MSAELAKQASELYKILSGKTGSDIIDHADELLLFLNRLQEFIRKNPLPGLSAAFVAEFAGKLESDPDAALRDPDLLERLNGLFEALK